MRTEKIRAVLQAAPFRPFHIHLSDGSSVAIRHPDFASIAEDRLVVTVFQEQPEVTLLDPLHVTRIVLLSEREPASAG